MAKSKELQAEEFGKDTWRIFRLMAEFVEAFEELNDIGPAVSIFGSARTPPTDPYYIAAEKVAGELAKRKYSVITGGGPGIMEAGNKGAIEAGGKSIGLNISLPHEQASNRYQTISVDFRYFYARKVCFTKYASAFICFPGGFGTLDECFENLTLIQTLKIAPFPVILYGSEYWDGLLKWMRRQLLPAYISPEDLDVFRVVDTPQDAVNETIRGIKKPWWKPVNGDNGGSKQKNQTTVEGTRGGKPPTHTGDAHARPAKRPPQ